MFFSSLPWLKSNISAPTFALLLKLSLLPVRPKVSRPCPKVAELFNVELPDLLVSSWKKARELQEALEESRKSPEEVIVLDLAEHEITNEYHPNIEIRIAGLPLPKKIEFKVQIVTALKGINLKIQAGTITEIQAGSCDFEGKIKYEDACHEA